MKTERTVWLTGATSGIGEAVLEKLIADGHRVIATGRNRDKLDALVATHGERVIPLPGDTTSAEDSQRFEQVLNEHAPIDWAILNAGTCEYMDVNQFDADMVDRVLTTNVTGTARSVGAVLPVIRAHRAPGSEPQIALVSSSAWWFPFGRAEAYGASKAAMTYFGQSLRADLAAEKIRVPVISPGFVKTPLTDQNDFNMPFLISAEEAARRIVRGLEKGKAEIHFPKRFTWTLKILGALPQRWVDAMAAKMSRNSPQD